MNNLADSERAYARYKAGQAIINDAPPPDDDILKVWLQRLKVPLPVAVQFNYDEGEEVNERWIGYRSEVVTISAGGHVPFWYPWVYHVTIPAQLSRTTYFGNSEEIGKSALAEDQAVIRWRAWKKDKSHSDGYLEIALEPDPQGKFKWREHFSIHTFNNNLNVTLLQDYLKTIRTRTQAGVKAHFEKEQDFRLALESAFQAQLQYNHRPKQADIAEHMGMSRKALYENLTKFGLVWSELLRHWKDKEY